MYQSPSFSLRRISMDLLCGFWFDFVKFLKYGKKLKIKIRSSSLKIGSNSFFYCTIKYSHPGAYHPYSHQNWKKEWCLQIYFPQLIVIFQMSFDWLIDCNLVYICNRIAFTALQVQPTFCLQWQFDFNHLPEQVNWTNCYFFSILP